jgi:hypothetical protein
MYTSVASKQATEGGGCVICPQTFGIVLQNVEKQNVVLQNVEKQNVKVQNIELQNVELQNVEWTKCWMLRKVEKQNVELQIVKLQNVGSYKKVELQKVENYKKLNKEEKYGIVYKKSAEIFFIENQKGSEKFPWALFFYKQCSKKQNVENYKKLEKQSKHELFRYKVRNLYCYLYSTIWKIPLGFSSINSVIEEIAEMKGYRRLGIG